MKEGPYALDMTKHTLFCEDEIVNELCAAKTLLDTIPDRDFRNARNRANPFEMIKKEIFGSSRAALKMAEIDAACSYAPDKFSMFPMAPAAANCMRG